jgi:hypothetical protein
MQKYPQPPVLPAIKPGPLYPLNWLEISESLKLWTGWGCEVCGHKHDAHTGYCLTVHHLDMNPCNNDWHNLLVCCQRCHLRTQSEYWPGMQWLFDRPTWAEIRGL